MQAFAAGQVASRLGDLASHVQAAVKESDADAVHDLRVSIRRLGQSLDVFGALLPKGEAKKVRKTLSRLMAVAGQIRDRDIALEFLAEAGLSRDDQLWKRLKAGRRDANKDFARRVKRWSQGQFADKWRSSLRLDG
jgi:CHAD domain-containing protein